MTQERNQVLFKDLKQNQGLFKTAVKIQDLFKIVWTMETLYFLFKYFNLFLRWLLLCVTVETVQIINVPNKYCLLYFLLKNRSYNCSLQWISIRFCDMNDAVKGISNSLYNEMITPSTRYWHLLNIVFPGIIRNTLNI